MKLYQVLAWDLNVKHQDRSGSLHSGRQPAFDLLKLCYVWLSVSEPVTAY